MAYYLDFWPKCAGGSFKPFGKKGIDKFYQPQIDEISNRVREMYSGVKTADEDREIYHLKDREIILRGEFPKLRLKSEKFELDLALLSFELSEQLPIYLSIPFDLEEVVKF